MAKTKRSCRRVEKKKAPKSTLNLEEIINEDGILCSIISMLPLKEAVRTCVLSSRWRYIWNRLPSLIFDAATMLDAHTQHTINLDASHLTNFCELFQLREEKRKLLREKTEEFIRSVDSVLERYHCSRIDEFVVRHFLHKVHSSHIDAWVRFAIASKAKRLVLDLKIPFKRVEFYDFPCQLLELSSIEKLSLVCCSLKLPRKCDVFDHLKELSLSEVDITGEDMRRLLLNCSALQKLTLWKLGQLESLSISQSPSHLSNLLVADCDRLREIKINAANLSMLHYRGVAVDLRNIQSSQMKDIDVQFKTEMSISNLDIYLTELSSSFPQLKSLTFNISGIPKVDNLPNGLYSFTHLVHLDWTWNENFEMSIFHLAALLDAAPFLEELKLRLSTDVVEEPPRHGLRKLAKRLPTRPHTHLKTIEISGFLFDKWQVEIALYIVTNATDLKSMIIKKGHSPFREMHQGDINTIRKKVPTTAKFTYV